MNKLILRICCFVTKHRWEYFDDPNINLKHKLVWFEPSPNSRVCLACGKEQEIIGEVFSDSTRSLLWGRKQK